jgi:site-specific recombinase XerD
LGKEAEMAQSVLSEDIAYQPRDSSVTADWQSSNKGEPIEIVFDGLARMDLPGKEHLQRYLRDLARRNFRRLTILQALSTLKFFLAFLKNTGSCLEKLSRGDLEAFIESEQDRGLKLSSVRTKLDRVYAFWGFLIEEGMVAPDICVRKIRLKVPQYLPRAIDPEDVRKLVSVIGEPRDRAVVLVLLRTGMRISELLAMRVSDVNIKDRRVTIREGAKTRRGRVVYFSDDASHALKTWLGKRDSTREFLFYAPGRSTLSYTSAHQMFTKYLKWAGLAHKGYTLHCLRHTFASELLNAGMRLECLQQLLGHDSIQVTRRYARLTDKTREDEYFLAMAIIEKGGINGTYRLDRKLQTIPKEKERCTSYSQKLYDKPQAVSPLAGRVD